MDGAVLSAPYEPERKQANPAGGGSNAPRTEVMTPQHSQPSRATEVDSAVGNVHITNADQSETDANAWLWPLLVVVLVVTVLVLIFAVDR